MLPETFCYGDVLYGDVLSRRRFVRRRFLCAPYFQLTLILDTVSVVDPELHHYSGADGSGSDTFVLK
jgi:hypothetical protein